MREADPGYRRQALSEEEIGRLLSAAERGLADGCGAAGATGSSDSPRLAGESAVKAVDASHAREGAKPATRRTIPQVTDSPPVRLHLPKSRGRLGTPQNQV